MKNLSKTLILGCVLLIVSCSSLRMRYEGSFVAPNKKEGKFVFEKSYRVGSIRTFCWLTFWVYGGACWAYFLTPFDSHEDMMKSDAIVNLEKEIGSGNIYIKNDRIMRMSWENKSAIERVSINDKSGRSSIKSSTKGKSKSSGEKENLDGFLR